MPHQRIEEIQTSFDAVFTFIDSQPNSMISGLLSTGDKPFTCEARFANDGRRFIHLPHSNRIYKNDWGFYFNSMGESGQRIGQYSVPINN